ncbi:YibE/F family protein [Candidatus Clostridium stratigraminis]|uniref:YibE/F family protein n=1 Tax=Candidatus Clostridium stratigraminis TaxID=3381661 RepID=A0ABW8TA03_9CLOT
MKKHRDLLAILVVAFLSLIIITTSSKLFGSRKEVNIGDRTLFYEVAKVLEVSSEDISKDPTVHNIYIGEQQIKVEILTGKYAHQQFDINNSMSVLYSVRTKVGMKVIVGFNVIENKVTNLSVYNYKRNTVVYWLIAIFFALLIFVGRKKGLNSLISIIFSIIVIFYFMLPSILSGFDPVISATISAALITFIGLIIISGFNSKTYSAIIGTISGLTIAGIIAFVFGHFAHLTGLTAEYSENLIAIAQTSKFNLKGLMYAVILIASLGAVMDIGISIASAIFEIHSANPKLDKKQLFNSGMNMGKDIIGTMSNTLILAFAGSSFSLLIIIATANMSYIQVSNLDLVCTEIIQGIAGSIGIILTVPLTALVSVLFIERSTETKHLKNKIKKSPKSRNS